MDRRELHSMTFSLPSATPEVLTGDVLKRVTYKSEGVRWGYEKWEVVLTASGIPVVDRWKMPRDWRDDIDAARYAFRFK